MPSLLQLTVFSVFLTAAAVAADSVPEGPGKPAGNKPDVCQVAVLRNGFHIQYTRREAAGSATRLWLCAEAGAGYVELPSEQIGRFEERQSEVPFAPAAPASAPEKNASTVAPAGDSIKNWIDRAASRYQIDPDFVSSVVQAESGFNATAVSPKGARGLMQLMPQTAAWLGVENVLDPAANLEGGTRYLRQLLDQYGGDAVKALAAYNAGPLRVEQYGGIPPYRETRAYVNRIIDDYSRKKLRRQDHSTAAPAPRRSERSSSQP